MDDPVTSELSARIWAAFQPEHYATCLELLAVAKASPNPFWRFLSYEVLRRLGRYSEARAGLLTIYPEMSGRAHSVELSIAQTLDKLHEDTDAELWFRRAIASAPLRSEMYVFFAVFLMERERFAESIAVLEQGMSAKIDPPEQNEEILLNLCIARRSIGDLDGAKDAAERALNINPKSRLAATMLDDVDEALRIRATERDEKGKDGSDDLDA